MKLVDNSQHFMKSSNYYAVYLARSDTRRDLLIMTIAGYYTDGSRYPLGKRPIGSVKYMYQRLDDMYIEKDLIWARPILDNDAVYELNQDEINKYLNLNVL